MIWFWKLGIIIFFYLVGLVFVAIATYGDVRMFKNENTRKKVANEISTDMSDKELLKAYLKQNLWEMTMFWIGLTIGITLGWRIS